MTDRNLRADQLAYGRRNTPQADDARLAEIREFAGFLSAIGPDTEGGRLGYLLARVDQLTAERDALRDARNRVLLLIAEADVIGLVSGHGFSVNDVRSALRLEVDHA